MRPNPGSAGAPAVPVAPAGAAVLPRPLVSLRNVSFEYPNGTLALRGLSLSVSRNRTVGIVGPSGCGKSTLLGLIAGLHSPASGNVDLGDLDAARHPVSMVFQKDTLLPWLTVADNIALFYRFHRAPRTEVAALVHELTHLAGLEGFESAYPYQLSGGMRRRVAFLAGVAAKPQLLLLDEPFSSVDEPTRVAIHQDVFTTVQRFDMTVVLVTHDLAEAISLCDEVVILTQRPSHIYSHHTVPFGVERNMLELRQTPAFLELYGTLWHELSMQIQPSEPGAAAALSLSREWS